MLKASTYRIFSANSEKWQVFIVAFAFVVLAASLIAIAPEATTMYLKQQLLSEAYAKAAVISIFGSITLSVQAILVQLFVGVSVAVIACNSEKLTAKLIIKTIGVLQFFPLLPLTAFLVVAVGSSFAKITLIIRYINVT